MPQDPNCKRCPLHVVADHVCMWGSGAKNGIMLIGEAPGAEDDSSGKVFASNKLLRSIMREVGLPSDTYVTYATKCAPPGRSPNATEAAACLPYLADEIATVAPKVIVCIGGGPLKILTGLNAVGANRGKVLQPLRVRTDAKIIVTYHPSAAAHNPRERDKIFNSIREDLSLALSLTREDTNESGGGPYDDEQRAYITADSSKRELIDALEILATTTDTSIVADCEWLASPEIDDLIWPWDKRSQFLSLAMSARLPSGVVYSVGIEWNPKFFKILQSFMRGRRFIFHNAMSDLIWLLYLGFEIELAGDTLILAYLMDEEQRLGLGQLGPLKTGVKPGWKKPIWKRVPRPGREVRQLLDYNCDDTYVTLKLNEALRERTGTLSREERANILRAYFKLLLPAVPVYARIAINGIGMDVQALENAIIERRKELSNTVQEMAELTELPTRMVSKIAGSPQQTVKFLAASYGLELPSSRKEDLDIRADDYPIIGLIRKFRHERKLLGTYLEPWRRLIDNQEDGRIHSVYRLASSRTGRTSAELSEGGSLQLAPRERWVRRLVSARQAALEGTRRVVIAADYSQIELRVAAWLAPEPTMRQLYQEGADLHATTAAYIKAYNQLKLPVAEFWKQRQKYVAQVTKEERQGAKGYNFGLLYGMQAESLVGYVRKEYGVIITLQDAITVRKAHFSFYKGLQAWHDRVTEEDFVNQRTLSPTGRYRRSFKSPTEAINTPIQTTASDLTLFAMRCIEEELIRCELMRMTKSIEGPAMLTGFVHDSVLLECDEDVADDVAAIVKATMENPPLYKIGIDEIPVPLVADVAVGANWGDAE